MPRLDAKFARDPSLKVMFELQRSIFNEELRQVLNNKRLDGVITNHSTCITIPAGRMAAYFSLLE